MILCQKTDLENYICNYNEQCQLVNDTFAITLLKKSSHCRK